MRTQQNSTRTKAKNLYLVQMIPSKRHRDQLFGRQVCGKGPRLLEGSKMAIGQKHAPEAETASGILSCMSRNRTRVIITSAQHSLQHICILPPAFCPQYKEDIRELETVQQKPPLWWKLEHLCCAEKLGELDILTLEQR